MQRTATSSGRQTDPLPDTGSNLFGTAMITLDKIWRDDRMFFASFRVAGGGEQWFIEVRPDDLADFVAFRRAALLQRGVWIRHRCETEPTDRAAEIVWADEVAKAFDRGAER